MIINCILSKSENKKTFRDPDGVDFYQRGAGFSAVSHGYAQLLCLDPHFSLFPLFLRRHRGLVAQQAPQKVLQVHFNLFRATLRPPS